LIEGALVIALAAGIGPFLAAPGVTRIIALVGGSVLILMGLHMAFQGRKLQLDIPTKDSIADVTGPVLAGIWTSASNPYFFIWWATIGLSFITDARTSGAHAVGVFYAGHILSDLVWFSFIAWMAAKGRRFLPDRVFRSLVMVCGLSLVGLGAWFILA
jgi:threonine/homoserine/homoserine lactone efflux protein